MALGRRTASPPTEPLTGIRGPRKGPDGPEESPGAAEQVSVRTQPGCCPCGSARWLRGRWGYRGSTDLEKNERTQGTFR